VIREGCAVLWSQLNLTYETGMYLDGLREITKRLVSLACLWAVT